MLHLNSDWDRPNFEYLHHVLNDSMGKGVRVDITHKLRNILNNELVTANLTMQEYGLMDMEPASVIRVLKSLAKDEPLVETYCCKDGKWSSNKVNLKLLAHHDVKFASDLLTYRKILKLVQTLNSLEVYMDDDGLIHPKVTGSASNRIQYSDPGLLTIPKILLWTLIKPREKGWSLYSIDVKNQEPWIMINMLNIESLKEVLLFSDYTGLYNVLFNLIFKRQPTPIERKEFKQVWNALTYGASKAGACELCYNISGTKVFNYFNKLVEYKDYKQHMYALAGSGRRSTKTLFHTKVTASPSKGKKSLSAKEAARKLMDLGVQGTGADILAFLVENFNRELVARGLSDHMYVYMTRHDEIIVAVNDELEKQYSYYWVVDTLYAMFEHQVNEWEPFRLEIEKVKDDFLANDLSFRLEDEYDADDD